MEHLSFSHTGSAKGFHPFPIDLNPAVFAHSRSVFPKSGSIRPEKRFFQIKIPKENPPNSINRS